MKKLCLPIILVAVTAFAAAGRAASKPKLDPESEKWYRTASLIMTKEESKIFARLPDPESRKEFISDFWAKRDPDPDTPVNEYKQEFEARVEYVNKRFNKEGGPGYNTDRGRIYIFMGPPDKFEEFFPQGDPNNRGSIIWWIYYDSHFGIEFADEKGSGKYSIRSYDGDFFGAMDLIKLGNFVRIDDVFTKKFVKFATSYDPAVREIEVRIPSNVLMFRENDEGKLQIDLFFTVYIYGNGGTSKETFREVRTVVTTEGELSGMKTVTLRFARTLGPGTNFVDVIIKGPKPTSSQIRRIFEIKVAG
jgi:GWxTD domain-containing protein